MKTFLVASLAAVASADLKLAWTDCGDAGTHTKITGFTPSTLPLGKKTTMSGTGTLDEDIAAANFDLEMKTAVGTVSCKGDASQSKTCPLPLGTGSLTFDALSFPIKKGATSVSVDIQLSALLPPALASTTTKVTGTTPSGDKVFCMQITSSAAEAQLYEDYDFKQYIVEHGKSYSAVDVELREKIFKANLEKVKQHNLEYHAGVHTWWASMNHLADYTPEEFARLRSKKYSPSQHNVVELKASAGGNPDSIDWREKGAVTEVKNQGGCGSCWAFSATETLESAFQVASGKLLTLAPQTFVNCVKNPQSCGGTGGCEGATMELAFNLTAQTGIALESVLPYEGRDAACKPYNAAVKCTGYVKNPVNDAAAFETALATMPQAITVAAEPWQMYGGGVFKGCSSGLFSSNTLDHGVQAVGYTKDYWIVRNSWGASWGEKGFIRITRANDDKTFIDKSPADGVACKPGPKTQTVGGECGMLFDTSYPTGVSAADESIVVV